MLFVALLMVRPGSSFKVGGARRIQRQYPEGVNVVGEYWLETDSPMVIAIMETESMAPLGQIRMECGDMLEIEVFPAVPAEEGMQMVREAMPG